MEFKFESCSVNKYKRQPQICLNKYDNKSVTKPFFLTRQTANLMEDFTRELKAGASLFFLYGDEGVGKTRLLRELSQKRLSDNSIHWIDLAEKQADGQAHLEGGSNVEAVFEAAGSGDVIIADHFEAALKKTRHQLFVSWSTDGVDKRINLIIASDSESFNELRQLSQQYQVRVHSFQLMPFNPDEVEAFLGFFLFPDHPIGKLSIPAETRKQLVASHGTVGQIIKIADRDGAQIVSSPMTDTESIRKGSRIMVTMLILFALTIGVGWYFLSSQYDFADVVPALAGRSEPVVASEPEVVVETTVATVPEPEVKPEPETVPEPEPEPEPEINTVPEPEPKITALTEAELEVEPEGAIEIETKPESRTAIEVAIEKVREEQIESESPEALDPPVVLTAEPGTATDSDAVIVEEVGQVQESAVASVGAEDSNDKPLQLALSDKDRFAQDLKTSMDWINARNSRVGTVQILLLSFANFDPVAYYEYIDNLASRQVDVDEVRIFKTLTGGKEVYSVFYGEYDSRLAAVNALDGLPAVLREISPIGRSVGGILTEIQRLGAGN